MYGALFSPPDGSKPGPGRDGKRTDGAGLVRDAPVCGAGGVDAALLELARSFTPRIETAAGGLVVLDLCGLGRLWPSPRALGQALVEAACEKGMPQVHVAVAATRTAATLVAQARDGLSVVAAGAEADAVSPLPLEWLGLPDERLRLLRLWGLRTLGDLARLPAVGLSERLGRDGPRLRRLARGEDDAPLVPTPPAESFETTLEVEWPVEGLEPLSFLLTRVLESLCRGLRQRGRCAAALTLELRRVDGQRHARTLRPAAPSVEPRTWRTLLLLDLEAHPPGEAIQAVTVRAEPTEARVVQFSLLDPAQPSPERLAETLGRLRAWTDEGRAGSPMLLDTHRPGAFVLQTFSPGPARGGRVREPLWPRVALRAFRPPRLARVELAGGVPCRVSAAGVHGAVRERAGPWRSSGDWWDAAWSREEWDVELTSGGVYRLVLDRMRGTWSVDGVLD